MYSTMKSNNKKKTRLMIIEFIFLLILTQQSQVCGHVLLCGNIRNQGSSKKYDTLTHLCKDGKVINKSAAELLGSSTLPCGEQFEKYDNTTHKCVHGSVVLRQPLSEGVTHEIIRESRPLPTEVLGPNCSDPLFLNCSGFIYESCAKKATIDCCGNLPYRPTYDSCCVDKLFSGKPQYKHVCCKGAIYPRRKSTAPCVLAARNDEFLKRNPRKLKKKYVRPLICHRNNITVYHLRINGPHRDAYGRFLMATRMLEYLCQTYSCVRTGKKVYVRIPLDQYSPDKLLGGSFLIWSDHKYLNDTVFYRREGDMVFKAPRKRKALVRKLREIQKFCNGG